MEIAILSGKGGTGKTTIATNLARIMKMTYVDCDVEEPNGNIFLKADVVGKEDVHILNPVFDKSRCTNCGACVKACQFNALASVLDGIMLFEELCHGCGACNLACKQGAISEEGRQIGQIHIGKTDEINTYEGRLNIGEPMGGPIISHLKKIVNTEKHCILDASPGTSCSVVKTLNDVNYAVLVTEPTKFGLHDLDLAVTLVREMQIPFDVVINRHRMKNDLIESYCRREDIGILGKIRFSKHAAEIYSEGEMLIDHEEFRADFEKIKKNILTKINGGK